MEITPVYKTIIDSSDTNSLVSHRRTQRDLDMGGRGSGRRSMYGTTRRTRSTNSELLRQLKLMDLEKKPPYKVTPTKDKFGEDSSQEGEVHGSEGYIPVKTTSKRDKRNKQKEKTVSFISAREAAKKSNEEQNEDSDSDSSVSKDSSLDDSNENQVLNKDDMSSVASSANSSTNKGHIDSDEKSITSSHNEQGEIDTTYDYKKLPDTTNRSKPPLPRQINKTIVGNESYPVERNYKLHIKMRKHLKQTGQVINIVDHFKILLSRMIHEFPNLLLIPFDEDSLDNHIVQGIDVPSEEEHFTKYVKGARITKADSLLLNFKIISPVPFGTLKNKPSMFKFLQEKKYFIQLQTLKTYDNIKVGGFIFVHNQYVRRDDISQEIKDRINENHDEELNIQLIPYVFTVGEGEEKVITRTMAVETSVEEADEVRSRLFTAFNSVPDKWKIRNSSSFRFFPFRSSADIPVNAIKEFAKAQNNFLHNIAEVPIYNMKNLDWKIPGKEESLRSFLMRAAHPVTKEKLCHSIERTSTDDKHFIIVKLKYVSYVKEWLEKIAEDLEEREGFSWMTNTQCHSRFRFTFSAQNRIMKAYSEALLQQISPNFQSGEGSDVSSNPPPPKKRSRNKIITYEKPTHPAWNNSDETLNVINTQQSYHTNSKSSQQNTTQAKKSNSRPVEKTGQLDSITANALEKKLLERVNNMNNKMEEKLTKIRTTSNNTNLLVQKMLDNQDKVMEENAQRDKRIDMIQEGMISQTKTMETIQKDSDDNFKRITKALTALYNKISPGSQHCFEDWEYGDESTLDEILSLQTDTTRQDKKRKTSIKDVSMHQDNMETSQLLTQSTPASESGLRGVENK